MQKEREYGDELEEKGRKTNLKEKKKNEIPIVKYFVKIIIFF